MEAWIYSKENNILIKADKIYTAIIDHDDYCSIGLYCNDILIKEYATQVEASKVIENISKTIIKGGLFIV